MPYYDSLDLPENDMIFNDHDKRSAVRLYNAVKKNDLQLTEMVWSNKLSNDDRNYVLGKWLRDFLFYEYKREINETFTVAPGAWGVPSGENQDEICAYIDAFRKSRINTT